MENCLSHPRHAIINHRCYLGVRFSFTKELIPILKDQGLTKQFTILTFCIAFIISGTLIILSQFGYTVYNWVDTPAQFLANIPFSLYIMSPAIACYIVLRKNNKVTGIWDWLRNVFYVKNSPRLYVFVFALLTVYFTIHFIVADNKELALPFYTVLLSLFGNLIIGGLEESGWMYLMQPQIDDKFGYIRSSLIVGVIWLLWHVPLFFIAGTNHGEGLINFGMFALQVMTFRFVYGAIYRLSGKGGIFMCILYHTLFNSLSAVFGTMVMNWTGMILANATLLVIAIAAVALYGNKQKRLL